MVEPSMLKYYVYISATKVNMLYPQIPPAFLRGAEAELKINLGVISTTVKGRGPEEATELPARVAAVQSYLRNENAVGSIENPRQWTEGSMPMRWGRVSEYASDIAFFGGVAGKKRVALIGSSDSLIGTPQSAEANHGPFYYQLKFFNAMLESKGFKAGDSQLTAPHEESNVVQNNYASLVGVALDALPSSEQSLDFLALVLQNEPNLIVATPLYVALAT
jgi:hypothetical protein